MENPQTFINPDCHDMFQVAKDGNDQNEISLLDSRGCPSEGQIMGPLLKSPDGNEEPSIFQLTIFCHTK